jgi:hypothetical protein
MAKTHIAFGKKGNAKRGVSPRLKIRPCDLDLWPWKSIWFQILLRSKYVPSLVKIRWRMLILECSQGCYAVKIWPGDIDLWPMTLKINRVPDSPKDYVCTKYGQNPLKDLDSRVFTRMLYGKKNYPVTLTFDLWPWKSMGFQTLLRTTYVPSLVKIHWRILILECSQGCYTVKKLPSDLDLWPMTLKINGVPDSSKD